MMTPDARNIRELRERKGYTLGELADRAGLSRGYLSECENDKKHPSIKTIYKLAGALGCSAVDIIDEERRAV